MTLITFQDGTELTAAQLNQLQVGLLQSNSATPLILSGSGIQLTVAGSAVINTAIVTAITATTAAVSTTMTVPTAAAYDNSKNAANTAWVQTYVTSAIGSAGTYVAGSVAITGGTINGTSIGLTTPASGAFSALTAPTQSPNTVNSTVATTAYVAGQAGQSNPIMDGVAVPGVSLLYARQDHVHPINPAIAQLASPVFTGAPLAPTATTGNVTTQIATTAFVANALSAFSLTGGSGGSLTITGGSINSTPIGATTPSSGVFSSLTAPTRNAGDITTNVATTAFVTTAINTAFTPSSVNIYGGAINNTVIGLTTPASGYFSSLSNYGPEYNAVRIVTASGTVSQLLSDYIIIVNKIVGAPTTVTLLPSPAVGLHLIVKDGKGDAGTNEILIIPTSGTIDGQSAYVINTNYGSIDLIYTGYGWSIIESTVLSTSSGSGTPNNGITSGIAVGSSVDIAYAILSNSAVGTALGSSIDLAHTGYAAVTYITGSATGSSIDVGIPTGSIPTAGSATGTSYDVAVGSSSAAASHAGVAIATGQNSYTVVGTSGYMVSGSATGSTIDIAISGGMFPIVGAATGSTIDIAVGQGGASESATGTTVAIVGNYIYASPIPGTASTGTLNAFSLATYSGYVMINGSNDTSTSNAVELFYSLHYIYYENIGGAWFRWVSSGVWTPVTSPLTLTIEESPSGTSITTTGQVIYASSNLGVAASNTAALGAGLYSFGLSANPGLVVFNGTPDSNTSNVVQLYYQNHYFWQLNSAGYWYQYIGGSTNDGYTIGVTTSPIPTTPTLNVGTLANQAINTTFLVSGTYQAYSSTSYNLIANSLMQGAVIGGSLPTGWFYYQPYTDVTGSVAGLGIDGATGLNYVSINWTGTGHTGGSYQELIFGTITTGVSQQPYTLSGYFSIVSGSSPWAKLSVDEFASGTYLQSDMLTITTLTSTLQRFSITFTPQPTTTLLNFIFEIGYNSLQAVNATFNVAGVQFQTGSVATAFFPTPASATPTLQYKDNSNSWQSLPSAVGVTPSTWYFVHPPVTSTTAGMTVSVRDINNPTISAISNSFQVYTPGFITLQSGGMSLSNNYFGGTTASGTVIGQITVPASGGVFNGSIAVSPSTYFSVNSSYQLITNAVVNAGSYPITLTATMNGAINSPQTLATTITISAESANGTTLTSTTGSIIGSLTPGSAGTTLTWAMTSGAQITLNNVLQTTSNSVTTCYYIGHNFYQFNGTYWFVFNGTITGTLGTTGQAGFTGTTAPYPIISLGQTTVQANQVVSIPITTTVAGTAVTPTSYSLTPATAYSSSFSISGNNLVTTLLSAGNTYTINITANY